MTATLVPLRKGSEEVKDEGVFVEKKKEKKIKTCQETSNRLLLNTKIKIKKKNKKSSPDIYTLPCVRQIASGKLRVPRGAQLSASMEAQRAGVGEGEWEGGPNGGDLHSLIVGSRCRTAETNTAL